MLAERASRSELGKQGPRARRHTVLTSTVIEVSAMYPWSLSAPVSTFSSRSCSLQPPGVS